MSFLIINILVFTYIAALMYDSKNIPKENKTETTKKYQNILDYTVLAVLTIVLITTTCATIAQYCIKDEETKKKLSPYNSTYRFEYINSKTRETHEYKNTLAELQQLMKDEPYYKQNEIYNQYWDLILKNTMKIESNQLAKYLKFINNQYTTIKMEKPMKINTIIPRAREMANAYTQLKEMNYSNPKILNEIERLKQIIQDEYETNIVNIKDKDRNGLEQEQIDKITGEYEKISPLQLN